MGTSTTNQDPTPRIPTPPPSTIHPAGCGCPYCIVRARNTVRKTKLTFEACSAIRTSGKNGKNSVSCHVAGSTGCPTPLVNLRVCITRPGNKKVLTSIRALLDTGASVDIVTTKFARRHNLTIAEDKDDMIELIAAEGNAIKVARTMELEIQLPGGGWAKITALVCPKLSHDMLLSWVSQKKLQMLHKGWPFKTIQEYTDYSTAYSVQPPVTPRGL